MFNLYCSFMWNSVIVTILMSLLILESLSLLGWCWLVGFLFLFIVGSIFRLLYMSAKLKKNFFFNFIYLFIYLFMAVLCLCFCARAFSSCSKRGPLFIAERGPLTIAASLVAEHRLQTRRLGNCGSRA